MTSEQDSFEKQIHDYISYLDTLFGRAYKSNPLELLFAILRVGYLVDQDWDPFEESQRAFKELNWLMEKADKELSDIASSRIALLMYCQVVEMTVPHILLANSLNIIAGKPYVMDPFFDLSHQRKKGFLNRIPASATVKMHRIKKLAKEVQELKLIETIESFFDDRVRNAFSHSDYIFTKDYFRWTEGGPASQMSMSDLEDKIRICFAFYGALLECGSRWRRSFGKFPRYHKLPNYEVLELLKDEEELVTGFKIHFSNGSYASYSRGPDGSKPMNVRPNQDGSINFFVGDLDKFEKVWKIDGKPVTNWDKVNNN
ncbi:MAG: hypothetical protein WCZ89_06930 [Phycisphaerae bacterium]